MTKQKVRTMPGKPMIRAFFNEPTNIVSYLIAAPATNKAVIIDPVLMRG